MMAGKEVRKVLKRMKNWAMGLPKPVKWAAIIVAAPLGCMVMSFALILTVGTLIATPYYISQESRTGPEHYQYIFERSESRRNGLFGYGEYKYCSYLLLFPRETPSTLDEYYYRCEPGPDVDGYGVYFTCKLTEENYAGFAEGIENFAMYTEKGDIKPIYDTEHFQHPTYILQWLDVDDKWEVLEYIMLDEANSTAVFVYTMLGIPEDVEENSSYTTMPSEWNILSREQKMSKDMIPSRHREGFSIYANFDTATYDLSFLDYLK